MLYSVFPWLLRQGIDIVSETIRVTSRLSARRYMSPDTELQIVQHNQPPINPWTICPYELMTDLELPLRMYVVPSP